MSKLMLFEAELKNPNRTALRGITESRLRGDVQQAVDVFNATFSSKPYVCEDFSLSADGSIKLRFLIRVPDDWEYKNPFLRVISEKLANEHGWRGYVTSKKALLRVTKKGEEVDDGFLAAAIDNLEPTATIAMAKVSFEIIGGVEILEAVKALVRNCKTCTVA